MSSRGLDRATRRRAFYTGEPYRTAHARLEAAGRDRAPIPDAGPDQRMFEHMLFANLIRQGDFVGYPAMIRAASPHEHGLTLHLGMDSLAQPFLDLVLPMCSRADEYVEIGIPGLRVTGLDRRGLHLGWLDTSVAVSVRGVAPEVWDKALRASQRKADELGLSPLWSASPRNLHPHEASHLSYFRPLRKHDSPDRGWVSSAMLRRIGLLSRTSAYNVDSWIYNAQEGWVLELIYSPLVPHSHDLVGHLADPDFGLGMRVERNCFPNHA